jgi:hypothetical protein
VTAHLGAQLLSTVEQSFTYPLDHAPPGLLLYPVLAIGAGLVAVVAFGPRRRKDPLVVVGRGVLVGGAIMFLLALNAQGYRYELVFLPVMAVGAAALIEDALISGHRPATGTTKPRR